MKQSLADDGPFEALMVVYQDFYSYRSGVYRHVWGSSVGGTRRPSSGTTTLSATGSPRTAGELDGAKPAGSASPTVTRRSTTNAYVPQVDPAVSSLTPRARGLAADTSG